MRWIDELWGAVRETSFVAAQVLTLGVVAMVLGLMALNAIVQRPPVSPTPAGPSRPLVALVPTLVPDTPTPVEGAATPTIEPVATPTVPPTETPVPQPTVQATAPPATATPPPPTPTPRPAPPTPAPAPATPTSSVPGQLMKVLPTQDGLPARVRAEPSSKAPILTRVPVGTSLEVVGTANGDELQPGNRRWLKVRWKNVTGYVYSTLVGR